MTLTIPIWLIAAVLTVLAVLAVVLVGVAYLAKRMLGEWPERED
jgi:hypothetical protein